MGIFDSIDLDDANKIKDRQVFIRFGAGKSKCEVVKTGAVRTFKGKQPLYLVDFKVLETTDPGLKPGDVVNYSKNPTTEWGLKEVRSFLVAAAGLLPGNPEDQPLIEKEDWAQAIRTTSNNPSTLAGSIVVVEGVEETAKGSGHKYVKCSFTASRETREKRIASSKKK